MQGIGEVFNLEGRRIAIVDDTPENLKLLKSLLEKKARGITDYTAEAAFLQGAAAAQEGAYRDLVGSLNISVEEMKRMLRDCLPR